MCSQSCNHRKGDHVHLLCCSHNLWAHRIVTTERESMYVHLFCCSHNLCAHSFVTIGRESMSTLCEARVLTKIIKAPAPYVPQRWIWTTDWPTRILLMPFRGYHASFVRFGLSPYLWHFFAMLKFTLAHVIMQCAHAVTASFQLTYCPLWLTDEL